MSNRIHALAQQINGKAGLEEFSVEELRQIAHRYPYYAPAQFLLLQKLRQSGSPDDAEAQYRKAVLFYHDPLLFEHFIASNKFYVEEIFLPEKLEQYSFNRETEDADIPQPAEVTPDINNPIEETDNVEPNHESGEEVFKITDEPEETTLTADATEEVVAAAPVPEKISIEVDDVKTPEAVEVGSLPQTSAPAIERQEEKANEPVQHATGSELAFEPFHTVDYFASQGIRISQEELPKDKLGKQLKSFTEWLRTMKRLPAAQLTDNLESAVEKKVESMASHSVSESNVVTEAMAEVWLKQGNREKALDIYNKLSLHNPSKKAYFAAKIENLKQS